MGIDDLEELNDAFMFHLLHQFDFPLHGFPTVWLLQFVFLVDLEGHLLVGRFMQANANHGIGALANLLANHVLLQG